MMPLMYNDDDNNSKLSKPDRILVLAPIDDKASMAMVDKNLFTGGNELHAIMDKQTTLWSLKYKHGVIPEPFRQSFTSFKKAKAAAEDYYKRRGIKIEEVKD